MRKAHLVVTESRPAPRGTFRGRPLAEKPPATGAAEGCDDAGRADDDARPPAKKKATYLTVSDFSLIRL